jgi:hypothetical protein
MDISVVNQKFEKIDLVWTYGENWQEFEISFCQGFANIKLYMNFHKYAISKLKPLPVHAL